jgi:hypothetical protein
MKAISSSETFVNFRRTTRRYIPEEGTLHNHRFENFKSYTAVRIFIKFDIWMFTWAPPIRSSFGYNRRTITDNLNAHMRFWTRLELNSLDIYRSESCTENRKTFYGRQIHFFRCVTQISRQRRRGEGAKIAEWINMKSRPINCVIRVREEALIVCYVHLALQVWNFITFGWLTLPLNTKHVYQFPFEQTCHMLISSAHFLNA